METLIKYKKPLGIALSLLLGLIILSYTVVGIRNCYDRSQLEKATQELNQAANEKQDIEKAIANLDAKLIEANANVNAANANLQKALEETKNAQTNTNQSLDNVNGLQNKDYSNTTIDEAEAARCRAFPEACK